MTCALAKTTAAKGRLDNRIVHASPKPLSGNDGVAEFSFRWTAPEDPTVVKFQVFGLVGDADGDAENDTWGKTDTLLAVGCDAKEYFPDSDGDGFGDAEKAFLACAKPKDYLEDGSDCNDNEADVNPDAKELCNNRDDNCNGDLDEGLGYGWYYEDYDEDGYSERREMRELTCAAEAEEKGYVSEEMLGDCDPEDPSVYPGADEIPGNMFDDDCDDQIDEEVSEDDDSSSDTGSDGDNETGSGAEADDDTASLDTGSGNANSSNDRSRSSRPAEAPAGGCSTGGGAATGGMTLLLALLALGLTRRPRLKRRRY